MTERHIDPLDQAQEVTENFTADAVAASARAAAPQQVPREDGTYEHMHCVEEDCGVELPIERVRLGRIRCVDCQSAIEKFNKQFYKR